MKNKKHIYHGYPSDLRRLEIFSALMSAEIYDEGPFSLDQDIFDGLSTVEKTPTPTPVQSEPGLHPMDAEDHFPDEADDFGGLETNDFLKDDFDACTEIIQRRLDELYNYGYFDWGVDQEVLAHDLKSYACKREQYLWELELKFANPGDPDAGDWSIAPNKWYIDDHTDDQDGQRLVTYSTYKRHWLYKIHQLWLEVNGKWEALDETHPGLKTHYWARYHNAMITSTGNPYGWLGAWAYEWAEGGGNDMLRYPYPLHASAKPPPIADVATEMLTRENPTILKFINGELRNTDSEENPETPFTIGHPPGHGEKFHMSYENVFKHLWNKTDWTTVIPDGDPMPNWSELTTTDAKKYDAIQLWMTVALSKYWSVVPGIGGFDPHPSQEAFEAAQEELYKVLHLVAYMHHPKNLGKDVSINWSVSAEMQACLTTELNMHLSSSLAIDLEADGVTPVAGSADVIIMTALAKHAIQEGQSARLELAIEHTGVLDLSFLAERSETEQGNVPLGGSPLQAWHGGTQTPWIVARDYSAEIQFNETKEYYWSPDGGNTWFQPSQSPCFKFIHQGQEYYVKRPLNEDLSINWDLVLEWKSPQKLLGSRYEGIPASHIWCVTPDKWWTIAPPPTGGDGNQGSYPDTFMNTPRTDEQFPGNGFLLNRAHDRGIMPLMQF